MERDGDTKRKEREREETTVREIPREEKSVEVWRKRKGRTADGENPPEAVV